MAENKSKGQAAKELATKLNTLRTEKPKLFFGAIGAVAVALLVMMILSDDKTDSPRMDAVLKVGETYTLVNPNGGPVTLVPTPGFNSTADLDEMDKDCLVKTNTRVQLKEEVLMNYIPYVRLDPVEGECKGKVGWTSKVNIKK